MYFHRILSALAVLDKEQFLSSKSKSEVVEGQSLKLLLCSNSILPHILEENFCKNYNYIYSGVTISVFYYFLLYFT